MQGVRVAQEARGWPEYSPDPWHPAWAEYWKASEGEGGEFFRFLVGYRRVE